MKNTTHGLCFFAGLICASYLVATHAQEPLSLDIRKAHRIQEAYKEENSTFIRGLVAAAEAKAQTIEESAATVAQKAVALRSIIATLDQTFELWLSSNLAQAYVDGDAQTKLLLETTARKIILDKRAEVQADLDAQDAGLTELDETPTPTPTPEP